MRTLIIRTALIAGAALSVTACDRGHKAANNVIANEADANAMLSAPANDASAVESATNASERITPPTNNNAGADTPPPPSVNNVESNTVGM